MAVAVIIYIFTHNNAGISESIILQLQRLYYDLRNCLVQIIGREINEVIVALIS